MTKENITIEFKIFFYISLILKNVHSEYCEVLTRNKGVINDQLNILPWPGLHLLLTSKTYIADISYKN